MPVPFTATLCGEFAALSVTTSEAERPLSADGVKVTLMTQALPAASFEPQLLVCAKSPGLVPVKPIELNCSGPLPVSVSVIAIGAEVDIQRLVGECHAQR